MSFDPLDPRITAFVFGELSSDERKAFEAELSASPELQEAVQAILESLTARETAEGRYILGQIRRDHWRQNVFSKLGVDLDAIRTLVDNSHCDTREEPSGN